MHKCDTQKENYNNNKNKKKKSGGKTFTHAAAVYMRVFVLGCQNSSWCLVIFLLLFT